MAASMALPEMNGGDGKYSYAKNSSFQGRAANAAKQKIEEAIDQWLDLEAFMSSSNSFHVADFGCAAGPNTFTAMQNIIECVQRKHQSQCPQRPLPEFQVFFSDQTSNDFNTLFASLPPSTPYFAAGVPGSFHGRLFPHRSLHFAYSCASVQWLSKLPEEILDRTSPAWNKGRIHYANAPHPVVAAYAYQFAKDIQAFLDARAQELVGGGLMVILMPTTRCGVPFSQTLTGALYDLLGVCLMDMAMEGKVSEDLVDSYNSPMYSPSPEEMKDAVEKNGCFNIEKMEVTNPGIQAKTPGDEGENERGSIGQRFSMHLRAGMEGALSKHFGSEIIDELFHRFVQKAEEFPHRLDPSKIFQLFLVLKRK